MVVMSSIITSAAGAGARHRAVRPLVNTTMGRQPPPPPQVKDVAEDGDDMRVPDLELSPAPSEASFESDTDDKLGSEVPKTPQTPASPAMSHSSVSLITPSAQPRHDMTGVTPSFMDKLRTMIKQEIAGHLKSMDPAPSPAITPPALMNSMFGTAYPSPPPSVIAAFGIPGTDLITPDKMQNFYAKYRVENEEFPLQDAFKPCKNTTFERTEYLYQDLDCPYYLSQAVPQAHPSIPGLTRMGFVKWMTINILAYPDQESRRFALLLPDLAPLKVTGPDGTQECLPHTLPRNLLPATHDKKIACVTIGTYLFAIVYSPGAGPVPFTYSAEVYPLEVRSLGMSIATATTWFFNFVLAFTFPMLRKAFTSTGAFSWYAAWNLVGFFLTLFFVRETKEKTLEELDGVFDVPAKEFFKFGVAELSYFGRRCLLMNVDPPTPPYRQLVVSDGQPMDEVAVPTPNLDPDFDKNDFKAPMAGFGYGLPISRLYARYFGGDLKLISMEGYGTDVYLHLNRLSSSSEPLQ
ncbi:hypothetical protein BN1723_012768 [Verticillium longisporum]|uniref:DUF7514 domain-containing protein n=1 Tax=Verticillium longisporum TaxID=100787 RepID=A0A0G4LLB9_VERLO|nr:hypothetical protein BN1723_012768 [Verticillium longisporum]